MLQPAFLRLESDGAEHLPGAALPALDAIEAALLPVVRDRPGVRLHGIPSLSALLGADGAIGQIAVCLMQGTARPVRAVLFDKTPETNWALGWHQDRTIAVQVRREIAGFGPWTVKRGMIHVEPPFEILARMLTIRIHLDPVPIENAPLLIAPGSHRSLVLEKDIDAEVAARGIATCLADIGDIWAYSTPILHASDVAHGDRRRRVLQVDYAVEDLPSGLAWLGV